MPLYDSYPSAYLVEQPLYATHALYHQVAGFNVEHGGQVAFAQGGLTKEEVGLHVAALFSREEMVGSHVQVLPVGGTIVGIEVAVADRDALGSLDIDERHGVGRLLLVALRPKTGDGHLPPVDVEPLASLFVLIAGNVDAVDAVAGIAHAFAEEASVAPAAGQQAARVDKEPEAVTGIAFEVAFIVGTVCRTVDTVSVGLHVAVKLTGIDAFCIEPQTCGQRIGLVFSEDDVALRGARDDFPGSGYGLQP